MDEDEELYRLMNEEDDWYMGDLEEPQQPDKNSELSSNNGCAGVLLLTVVLTVVTLICELC
jgi:hypothetical protein